MARRPGGLTSATTATQLHQRHPRRRCGHTLRRLHAVDLARVLPDQPHPTGAVLVHGDYGPNNALLDSDASAVTAVLDWEWAHPLTWQQRLEITAGWVE